jgi:hypothetical protein
MIYYARKRIGIKVSPSIGNRISTNSITVISEGTPTFSFSLPLAFNPRQCSKKRFKDLRQSIMELSNFEKTPRLFTGSGLIVETMNTKQQRSLYWGSRKPYSDSRVGVDISSSMVPFRPACGCGHTKYPGRPVLASEIKI